MSKTKIKKKTELKFINHASVLISSGDVSLLSDPWYEGPAFNKGWSLVKELSEEEVIRVIEDTTHIWLSHEHPDHFSIPFFKKYQDLMRERDIRVLFQSTRDQRVKNFLKMQKLEVQELDFGQWVELSPGFEVLCVKDGFYDSGLAVKTEDMKLLNLNDCEIKSVKRCKEVLDVCGECDVLLTQFSYAAWKGGRDNLAWRQQAAKEKLETVKIQSEIFKPSVVVPIASYIRFANDDNHYLNDSINKPLDVVNELKSIGVMTKVMAPFDNFDGQVSDIENEGSIVAWQNMYEEAMAKKTLNHESVPMESLKREFMIYRSRVMETNSPLFMKIIRFLAPIRVLMPIRVELHDLDKTVEIDLFSNELRESANGVDISLHSSSLSFVFLNTFGFDTLTVNGCFEECSKGGFSRVARTMAIENLNNIGIRVGPEILTRYSVISLFFSKLWTVARRMRLSRA